MPAEKSDAIVLRVVEFSETSCIVTMLTREFGKITAIAKGARRPKSPFEAALDVLAICRIVFIHKTNAISLLTEAKLEHRFRAGESQLNRLYAGYYVVELLKLLTDDADPQPEVFELSVSMIRQLDAQPFSKTELTVRLLRFELGLLDLLGHLPMLTRCADCGREKTTLSEIQFGLTAGGVLCKDCLPGKRNVVTVSESAFQYLLHLSGAQIGEQDENSDNWNHTDRVNESRLRHKSWMSASDSFVSKKMESTEPDLASVRTNNDLHPNKDVIEEVRKLLSQYMVHLVGQPLRVQRFLTSH